MADQSSSFGLYRGVGAWNTATFIFVAVRSTIGIPSSESRVFRVDPSLDLARLEESYLWSLLALLSQVKLNHRIESSKYGRYGS